MKMLQNLSRHIFSSLLWRPWTRLLVFAILSAVPFYKYGEAACDVNTTIISVRENVPPGTVIIRLPRQSNEQWSFREDGPPGYIELKAHQHSVVFYFAKSPDLEQLSSKKSAKFESLPFTLECSFDGWKHVFKQSIVLMDVNDNDPVFAEDKQSIISVSEVAATGVVVLDLEGYATDPDISGYITAYDLARHTDRQADGYDHFTVSASGKELVIKQSLDFDQLYQQGRTFYLLNLTAMDNGYPAQRRAYLTLQVNITDSDDQGPAFIYPDCPLIDHFCTTPLFEAVARKSFKGELRVWPGPVAAVDKDSINNTVVYYLVTVSPELYSRNFKMDPTSGKVYVVEAFGEQNIDAIHVTIKAVENSTAGQYLTATLRVQVVGEYYASYRDSFRHVPLNEMDSAPAHSLPASTSLGLHGTELPTSLFIATVALFLLVVVIFPLVMLRLVKGRQALAANVSGCGGATSPAVTSVKGASGSSSCGDGDTGSLRKESSDSTTTSILTCTSNGDPPLAQGELASLAVPASGPPRAVPAQGFAAGGLNDVNKPCSVSVTVHQAAPPKGVTSDNNHSTSSGSNNINKNGIVPSASATHTYSLHRTYHLPKEQKPKHHQRLFRQRGSDCSSTVSSSSSSSAASSTSSSSSSSASDSPNTSLHMDFDEAASFAPLTADPGRRVSSVNLPPGEVASACTSFSTATPRLWNQSATQRLRRSLHRFFGFGDNNGNIGGAGPRGKKDRQRVRFDIRNLSNFS